jgi:hypothetical protein
MTDQPAPQPSTPSPRSPKRRVNRLHALRSKWGDCYWEPGDGASAPEWAKDPCEAFEPDLIEFENDVRADFVEMLRWTDAPQPSTPSPTDCDAWMGKNYVCTEPLGHEGEHLSLGKTIAQHEGRADSPSPEGAELPDSEWWADLGERMDIVWKWMPDDAKAGVESVYASIATDIAIREREAALPGPHPDSDTRDTIERLLSEANVEGWTRRRTANAICAALPESPSEAEWRDAIERQGPAALPEPSLDPELLRRPPAHQRQVFTDWIHEARHNPPSGPKNVTCGQIAEAIVARLSSERDE